MWKHKCSSLVYFHVKPFTHFCGELANVAKYACLRTFFCLKICVCGISFINLMCGNRKKDKKRISIGDEWQMHYWKSAVENWIFCSKPTINLTGNQYLQNILQKRGRRWSWLWWWGCCWWWWLTQTIIVINFLMHWETI